MDKARVLGLVAGMALGLAGALPASAMDWAKIKAHETPEFGSLQSAEVCAASMTASAYLAEKGSDDAKLYSSLGNAWLTVAAKIAQTTKDDYINQVLIYDMETLYKEDDATIKFYKDYCLVTSKQMLNG